MSESAPAPVCLLLPGTDGTGVFFADLAQHLKSYAEVRILTYPRDQPLDYDSLCQYLRPQLPTDAEYILIAESFAGPLAILLAHTAQKKPSKIILAASFFKAPWAFPPLILRLVSSAVGAIRPPEWLIQRLLLSPRNRHLSKQIAETITLIEPVVLKSRLNAALTCNLTPIVKMLDSPILYIRGQHDRLIPKACAEAFVLINPNVTVTVIDAAHFVFQDNVAALTANIIIPFLKAG